MVSIIPSVVLENFFFIIFPIRSYIKLWPAIGSHFEFSISQKRNNTWLASSNDHSWQLTIPSSMYYRRRRSLKFRPIRGYYGRWQPCWMTDQKKKVTKLDQDLVRNISAKYGSNPSSGSWEEVCFTYFP